MNIDFSFFYDKTKDAVQDKIGIKNNQLTYSIVNLNTEEYGPTISLNFALFNNRLNINTFYKYIFIRNKEINNIYKGNYHSCGATITGVINNDYQISIISSYNSRTYNANYYTTNLKPDITLSISKNFWDNQLNASFMLRNMFNTKEHFTFEENSEKFQYNSKMGLRVLSFSLSYNFGKSFETIRKNISNINNDLLIR